MQVLTFARFILETSLLEYKLNVEVSESRLAAATLVTAMKIRGVTGWVETLKVLLHHGPSFLYYNAESLQTLSLKVDLVIDARLL